MIPITYFPVATQHQFARNWELIRGKPYEHYIDGDLWLHDDVLPALRQPMNPAQAIRPDPEGLNSLLDPGYHAVENGYCELPDGTG